MRSVSNPPVIIGATRIPTGRFLGTLSSLTASQLGSVVVREAVKRARVDPSSIDEVIMGNVVSAGLGQNPARQAALHGGIPPATGAMTINKVCGSGLKAVVLAAQALYLGDQEMVVAGGMESMSNAPYLLFKARNGYRMGNGTLVDSMIHDGLWCSFNDYHMGNTGELVAREYGISREEQDRYALNSHQKAIAAIKDGRFDEEIIPVEIPQRKRENIIYRIDETPREDTSLERLAKLKPAFQKDGTVTAGNAPGVNDGAAAVVVTSLERARADGLQPLVKITGYATGGREPEWVMMAPVVAVRKLLKKTGYTIDDFGLIELNEAFSVQAMAVIRDLEMNPDRVNVNGGAVALGHPIGASGAKILVTLIHEMKRRNVPVGLATLCLGGGNAVAMSVELL
jgi:acetyl-CoA C-acetyltransferase